MKVLALIVVLAVSVHCDDELHEDDPICNGQIDGHKIQNLQDCSQFFQCINGGSYLEQCPDNTLFNSNSMQCDYMDNVNCLSTEDVPADYPICSDVQSGTAFPHRTDCTKYYLCDFDNSIAMACDVGLAFDVDQQQCIWADQNKCPKAFHM